MKKLETCFEIGETKNHLGGEVDGGGVIMGYGTASGQFDLLEIGHGFFELYVLGLFILVVDLFVNGLNYKFVMDLLGFNSYRNIYVLHSCYHNLHNFKAEDREKGL